MLTSATRNPEADVTIAFRPVAARGKTVVALVVEVATDQPFHPGGSHWDPLRHYVLERYASLQHALPATIRERLLDCAGPLLFVSGTMIG